MVKLHCDRCKKEIKDKYYTINIHEVNLCSEDSVASAIDSLCLCTTKIKTPYEKLKSTKMYCKNCKDKIESILWENYDNTDNCSFSR